MGSQKYKNEQISVRPFCGKRAMGEKKTEMVQKPFVDLFFFVATYGNEVISVGATEKTQTYGTVHAFRSNVQNLPLRTRVRRTE